VIRTSRSWDHAAIDPHPVFISSSKMPPASIAVLPRRAHTPIPGPRFHLHHISPRGFQVSSRAHGHIIFQNMQKQGLGANNLHSFVGKLDSMSSAVPSDFQAPCSLFHAGAVRTRVVGEEGMVRGKELG